MEKQAIRQVILQTFEAMPGLQLRSVRKLRGREEESEMPPQRKARKRQSRVDLSVIILTQEQRPVHVDELVVLLKERYSRLTDKDSLHSALAKDHQGILVHRVAPGKFAVRQ